MALVLADRVKETTAVTGTGTATLLGAATGYQSFSAIGNANTTYYVIAGQTTSEWEVGIGTYTSAGTTLSRDTILASSNSGSAVSFSAGTKDVWCDYPASKSINQDASGNVVLASASIANYVRASGSATGLAPVLASIGSDTNISQVHQSKGTGAIDLAAGSSGVNISNGGTVTAITRTGAGNSYTSFPTPAITAPTTAGGVQAVAAVTQMYNNGATVAGGGTGYTVNDVLTVVGGTPAGSATTLTVTSVSGGVVTGISATLQSSYTVLPSNPVSVTGGTGTGATFNLTWGVAALSVTTAGSGYVEQPTVSFSGGGGSGAAAYATVGSATVIRSLGTPLSFYVPGGEAFRISDNGIQNPAFINTFGSASSAVMYAASTNATITMAFASKGAAAINFATNGTTANQQFSVSHTASAVNYVQVTGAATTAPPVISAQGSDTNVSLRAYSKGTGVISFWTAAGSSRQFQVDHVTGTVVNYVSTGGSVTGAAPYVAAGGTDTNIDLTLTPKGTGVTRANGSALSAENGIIMNATTINTNATIATGYNAQSVGPMTIASGVSVTVASGQTWLVM